MSALVSPIAALIVSLVEDVVNVINELKGQSGITDDQILAAAQTAAAGNDQLYQAILARLAGTAAAPAAPSADAPATSAAPAGPAAAAEAAKPETPPAAS